MLIEGIPILYNHRRLYIRLVIYHRHLPWVLLISRSFYNESFDIIQKLCDISLFYFQVINIAILYGSATYILRRNCMKKMHSHGPAYRPVL
jgi:hypothetical protein